MAKVCNNCVGKMGLPAMGNCSGCGARISRMSDTYCDKCSDTKNCCKCCGKSMDTDTKSGDKDKPDKGKGKGKSKGKKS